MGDEKSYNLPSASWRNKQSVLVYSSVWIQRSENKELRCPRAEHGCPGRQNSSLLCLCLRPQQVGEEDFLAHSTGSYVISSGHNLIDTSTSHFLSTFWQLSWHTKLTIVPANVLPYMAQGGLLWWLRGKEFACNAGDARDKKQVQPLSQEDPLDEGIATHSSILAWRIPWTEEPEGASVHMAAKGQIQLKGLSMHAWHKQLYGCA